MISEKKTQNSSTIWSEIQRSCSPTVGADPLLGELSLNNFLNNVASSKTAIESGSTSAAVGALGLGLLSSASTKIYESSYHREIKSELLKTIAELEALREDLRKLVEANAFAVRGLRRSLLMPVDLEEQLAQSAQFELALIQNIAIPLTIARDCRQAISLARAIARRSNEQNIVAIGAGVILCEAALQSALLTIKDYQAHITDEQASTIQRMINECTSGLTTQENQVFAVVKRWLHLDEAPKQGLDTRSRIV